jgi:GAF domain
VPPAFAEFRKNNPPVYGPGTGPARILAGERVVHIVDLKSGDAYRTGDPNRRAVVDLGGARTVLLVPLLKNESILGFITIYRKEVRPYSDKQITLLQTFADQAVIAIENARLFNETKEALERQTATADILKVIASSPDDVQPVFEAIADQSKRLLKGLAGAVYSLVDDAVHLMLLTPVSPAADAHLKANFPVPLAEVAWAESARRGRFFGSSMLKKSRCRGGRGTSPGSVVGVACFSCRF